MLTNDFRIAKVQRTLRWFEEDIPLLNMRVKELSKERQESARQVCRGGDRSRPAPSWKDCCGSSRTTCDPSVPLRTRGLATRLRGAIASSAAVAMTILRDYREDPAAASALRCRLPALSSSGKVTSSHRVLSRRMRETSAVCMA